MRFLRQYRFVLLFFAILIFCSVMVLRQFRAGESKHVEMREAFILLHTRGYTNEAQRLYQKLLRALPDLSQKDLLEDFERTMSLVDPYSQQTNNLIWKYHWTVSNEIERKQQSMLERAKKLANDE